MCGQKHKALQSAVTHHVVGDKMDKHSRTEKILVIPIPENVPLTMKSELIAVKYLIHVTLDIPHAIDAHVNVPIVVTTQSALKSRD